MNVLRIVNKYFENENEVIDDRFYDPQDVKIDPSRGIDNLRERFNIWKMNKSGTERVQDKMADAAGHFKSCPYYVIEVKVSDIDKAKRQLTSTVQHIYDEGDSVRKIAIILDENRWNKRLANLNYKIERDLLFRKKKINNDMIYYTSKGRKISRDIYCYLEDFKKFNG